MIIIGVSCFHNVFWYIADKKEAKRNCPVKKAFKRERQLNNFPCCFRERGKRNAVGRDFLVISKCKCINETQKRPQIHSTTACVAGQKTHPPSEMGDDSIGDGGSGSTLTALDSFLLSGCFLLLLFLLSSFPTLPRWLLLLSRLRSLCARASFFSWGDGCSCPPTLCAHVSAFFQPLAFPPTRFLRWIGIVSNMSTHSLHFHRT